MTKVRPMVRFFAVCADAVLSVPKSMDLLDGWWELHNVLHTVWMPPGVTKNFCVKELFVYAQLTDDVGEYNLGVTVEEADLANPKRNRLMGRSEPSMVRFKDTWEVAEVMVTLFRIPFTRPGQYHFKMMEGGEELSGGSCFLCVMKGETT